MINESRKTIPARMFYNHFSAIGKHIENDENKFKLKELEFYKKIALVNNDYSLEKIKKLLWNSWSTEYAFNIGSILENEEYYKCALHWSFPQVYYSIYLTMTAYHETQGIANNQHEKSINIFSDSIKNKKYPPIISFYSEGEYKSFKYYGLPSFNDFPTNFSGLETINNRESIQTQIALFLKTTREQKGNRKKEKIQSSPISKINKLYLTKKGTISKKFSKKHWYETYRSIPTTSLLDCLYRLRIKANYHDVDTFLNAELNFKSFYDSLGTIVNYVNFVHEAYITKAIGRKKYKKILTSFPKIADDTSASKRYSIIEKLY